MSWRPSGRPWPSSPAGTAMPGRPAMFTVTVKTSLRYMATGSAAKASSPIAKAADGVAGVDTILTPATPSAAFAIGDEALAADPVAMYLNDVFTVTVNMAGLPGIAVPAGKDGKGLPLGLQLIGKPFDEETLFAAARVIEKSTGTEFAPTRWW